MARARHILTTKLRHGFTLAESLVASVVLAAAVVGVSGALIASQSQTSAQQENFIAISLGRQLMEEVASLPLTTSDATSGYSGGVTNTTLYDTVDDYNGYMDTVTARVEYTTSGTTGTFSTATPSVTVLPYGSSSPTLSSQQYWRTVAVSKPSTVFASSDNTGGNYAIVTVTVHAGQGETVKLSRLVALTTIVR